MSSRTETRIAIIKRDTGIDLGRGGERIFSALQVRYPELCGKYCTRRAKNHDETPFLRDAENTSFRQSATHLLACSSELIRGNEVEMSRNDKELELQCNRFVTLRLSQNEIRKSTARGRADGQEDRSWSFSHMFSRQCLIWTENWTGKVRMN